jgi:hypothetical protein
LIVVDDNDLFVLPSEGYRTTAKPILPLGALDILDDLSHRGLANVEIGAAFEVMRLNLGIVVHDILRFWMLIAIAARMWMMD